MRILTKQKQVNFHGIDIMCKDDTRFLTADEDGTVVEFYLRPFPVTFNKDMGRWSSNGGFSYTGVTVDLEGLDWRDTLVEVE